METQFFQTQRGCLSYITYDNASREAVIIDPSAEMNTSEYLDFLQKNNLTLMYIIETHTHADHISSAKEIKAKTGAQIIRHTKAPSSTKDVGVAGGENIPLGESTLRIMYTPGHTNESISIYNGKEVFTGDTLLIGGTGRTDFQIGDSRELYQSLHFGIGGLPVDTLVRPGHDYKGRNQTNLGDELNTNPRIALCETEFIQTMENHHPPKPELFDISIEENSK